MNRIEIPPEVREEHGKICAKCNIRKRIARMVDMHFDWLDCPYDCENDFEHFSQVLKEEVEE